MQLSSFKVRCRLPSKSYLAIDAASVKIFAVSDQYACLLKVVTSVPQVVSYERAVVHIPVVRRDFVFVVSEVAEKILCDCTVSHMIILGICTVHGSPVNRST